MVLADACNAVRKLPVALKAVPVAAMPLPAVTVGDPVTSEESAADPLLPS
jgi:hypothetical protein